MNRVIILQHVDYAGPGLMVNVFRDYGIPLDVRRLWQGDEVPSDLEAVRMLVVLSGPMRVSDLADERYPFLSRELQTLQRMVSHDRPVLGIGLGAQLLAHAAGAKVYPSVRPGATPESPATPMPQFGWGPVTFPFPGGTEPLVQGLVDGAPMFHWHVDTFDLPKLPAPANPAPPPAPPPPTGNALLSSSRLSRNQAFRFKTRLFGFQYHFELRREDIDAIVAADKSRFVEVLGADAESTIRQETEQHYARYERLGDRVLRNVVQYMKVY
jgi:GMP synthase (glutamine-hydrolysing)